MAATIKKVEKWAQKKKVGKLLKALSTDSTEIRIAVIKALGPTNDENAMNTLTGLLRDPDALVRAAAAETLGVMGNGRSLEAVRQLLNRESDETVREKAKVAVEAIKKNSPSNKEI